MTQMNRHMAVYLCQKRDIYAAGLMITKQCFYPHKLDLDSFYNADIALQNIAINATINRSLNWPNGLHNTSQ